MTTRSDFRFLERLRVRWAEVDMQQIVFNGHYLMYADTAVAGYWRALALPYQAAMAQLGGDLFVRKATLDYLASAGYDDVLDVGVRCERIGNSSMVFQVGMFRAEARLVEGELLYVFADPVAHKAKPVPPELRAILRGFEAGEAMVEVRLGRWDEWGREAQAIRSEVFIEEQRIPAEMAWDAADEGGVHALAFNRLGLAVATGRLLAHGPGVAKIGRLAVRRPLRGSRVGQAVLDALMQAARARGEREVIVHAQMGAEPFYRRVGFVQRGPVFDEAGIAHVEMVQAL
jgi:YbgC/YbaW family acyl-CoA thioester hydrolase